MAVFKRGKYWHYRFRFLGQLVRESTHSESKTLAVAAERARRRQLEESFNRIPKRQALPLFNVAAERWLQTKETLAPKSFHAYQDRLAVVKKHFAKRLVCDITEIEIAAYQKQRLLDGVSARTVNYEVGCIRGVLKNHGLWAVIADKVKHLKQNDNVGKALSREEEVKLLSHIRVSRAPALLSLFLTAVDTGLRASELRHLRWRDVFLPSEKNEIGHLVVPKSKTAAGTGRLVPLTTRVAQELSRWKMRFPNAVQDSFVFPTHRVGQPNGDGGVTLYDLNLSAPIAEWKTAWLTACDNAGLRYRWHDLRHTFISRLAENPTVSEQTIRELAGHVSAKMMQHYSHIRKQAKVEAIAALEAGEC